MDKEYRTGKFFVPLIDSSTDYQLKNQSLSVANRTLLTTIKELSTAKYQAQKYLAALQQDVARMEEQLKQMQ